MEKITDVKGLLQGCETLYIATDSVSEAMVTVMVVVGSNEFAITIPIKDGFFHPLAVGTPVNAYFYSGSGRYYFETKVVNRVHFEELPVLVLDFPEFMYRTERRQYYRVDTLFPVKVIITSLVGDGDLKRVDIQEYDTRCVDLSGGGLQLDRKLSRGIPLRLNLQVDIDFCEALPGLSRATGVVVRKPIKGRSGWGIKFTKIFDSDRDKIIRYVFKRQFDDKKQLDVTPKS